MQKYGKKKLNIAIPLEMVERIKQVVASRLGYVTVAEYVREAVRQQLSRDERKLRQEEKWGEENAEN